MVLELIQLCSVFKFQFGFVQNVHIHSRMKMLKLFAMKPYVAT